jgi:Zn-dependent M28 family amino/carboxypeptidase
VRTLAFLLLVSGLAVAAGPAYPPDPTEGAARLLDDRILGLAADNSSIVRNLTELSDEIGPRLTGSKALNRACEWAAGLMKGYGLTDVRLEPWTIPEGWERGHARARLTEPDNGVAITMASYGWRPGTQGKVTARVVALQSPTLRELEKHKGKLKGAVVLAGPPRTLRPLADLAAPALMGTTAPGDGPRVSFAEMMAFARQRDSFLQKEGAAAVLLDGAKHFNLVPTTGSWSGTDRISAANRLPLLFVGHDHYRMLYRLATRPGKEAQIELDVENRFVPGPVKVFNVVGEIRGKDRPDEYVVVGAHIDSWDLAQGTTDNGTGTCITLEVARILAKCGARPSRTIRFCLFSGEEQGLHGSRAYVEKHRDEMPRTSCAFIHDVGTGKVLGLGVGGRPDVAKLLEKELTALRPLGMRDFRSRSGGGSDHQSFERAGVPGLLMVQDASNYSLSHHTAIDTVERLREGDLIQGASVIAVAAMRVANLPDLLPRTTAPRPKAE